MPQQKTKINNQIKKIPRPKGTTELSNLYNKTNNDNDYQNLKNHIIKHYINTDYKLNGIKLNLEQFCIITNIPSHEVYPFILNEQKLLYNFMDPEDKAKLFRELLNGILMGSLKDRLAVEQHVAVLLESQGTSYKPFISGEVSKAMKLLLDSNNQMLNVHQRFFGQGAPNIQINNIGNVQNSLSVSEAHMLIQSNQEIKPLLEDNEAREQLYLKHNLGGMPEVNANMQQGIDTSREGTNFNKVIMDANEGEIVTLAEEKSHIDRRAKELAIDLDEDEV